MTKNSITLRVDKYRPKVDGESFKELTFICTTENRRPSEMIRLLISEKYDQLRKKGTKK